MAFEIIRQVEGSGSSGSSNHQIVNYLVRGDVDPATDNADEEAAVMAWVQGPDSDIPAEITLPGGSETGYGSDVNYDWVGPGTWIIKVDYKAAADFRPTGEMGYSFNTAGGSRHITHAIAHVQTYKTSGTTTTAMDGSLNVNPDRTVAGMDKDVSGFDFQITAYITTPDSTYVDLLHTLTDTVNASEVTINADGVSKTYAAGECRFKGATGGRRGLGDMEVTFNFTSNKNLTGLTIGTIDGIDLNGQDYLWVKYIIVSDDTNKISVSVPEYVFVDQIYEYDNWTGLLPAAGL